MDIMASMILSKTMVSFYTLGLFSALLLVTTLKDGVAFVSSSVPSSSRTSTPVLGRKWLVHPFVASSSSISLSQSTATPSVTEPLAALDEKENNDVGTQILAKEEDFIKPERDLRQYRTIRLKNNLQVLLVSTSQSDETTAESTNDDEDEDAASHVEAAAVHVQAGHMDDTIPGLAHFHEHMLFLGTEKYPNEDEYEGFLSKYGGYSNAYTDMEDTNYYFSITTDGSSAASDESRASEGLHGGLDRLSQFFIAPTFEESMVDRELKAIDSEYRNSKTSDTWRNFQLLKSSCDPQHPFSNFGCGSYETLTSKASPRPALLDFWNQYYKTSNLRLAVVGHSSLDALQRSVEETFGQLAFSDEPHRRAKTNNHKKTAQDTIVFEKEHSQYNGIVAFGPDQVGKIKQVKPLLETRTMKLYFPIPPMDDPIIKASRPHRVISHLLGHESPGSLHCLLNDLGYLNALSSGIAIDISDFSLYSLTLSLTPEGMKAKDEILQLTFEWISLVKDTVLKDPTLMEQYHEELNQMAKNKFRFREVGDPVDFCSAASELMFDEITPPERILVASSTDVGPYNHDVAVEFLKRVRPENCLIFMIDSDLDDTSESEENEWTTEPWYGARYRTMDITKEQMDQWEFPNQVDSRLHLPALNKYIPTDFSMRCDDDNNGEEVGIEEIQRPPTLLAENPTSRLWHKMDKYWRIPKTFLKVSLVSPTTYQSPRTMTYSRIFQRVLNDDLNSFVYDAGVAGCSYRVSCVPTGWRISVTGFSEKLSFLLDTLTSRMLSLIEEMKQGRDANPALYATFMKAKQGLLRETKNYRLDSPYEVASYNSRLLIEENVWYLDNYIDEMEGVYAERNPLTLEECATVAEECLMGRVKAEILCMGNIDQNGATEVGKVIEDHFLAASRPLSDVETPRFRSLKLPTKEEAIQIFGPDVVKDKVVPLVYQELAVSESEETNAVEYILQAGCELDLGYEGIALLELISHIAYNSAYNQLRTKEQLGYIVSAFCRKTAGGTWGLSVVVQSSAYLPEHLEGRIEEWLTGRFAKELEALDPEDIADEASAVLSQLLERDTRVGQEVSRIWGDILNTEPYAGDQLKLPVFNRLAMLADELDIADNYDDDNGEEENDASSSRRTMLNGAKRKNKEEFKQALLDFFHDKFGRDSKNRRVMSARVYNRNAKAEYEKDLKKPGVLSSFPEMRYVKQFLSSWPVAPYWRSIQSSNNTDEDVIAEER